MAIEGEPHQVIDVMIIQQSGKQSRAWQHEGNVWNIIQCGGLNNYGEVALLDTPDRPVDQGIKDGTNYISDILVPYQVLVPNVTVYLG